MFAAVEGGAVTLGGCRTPPKEHIKSPSCSVTAREGEGAGSQQAVIGRHVSNVSLIGGDAKSNTTASVKHYWSNGPQVCDPPPLRPAPNTHTHLQPCSLRR